MARRRDQARGGHKRIGTFRTPFAFQKVLNCDWHGPRSHINRVGPIKTTDQVPAKIGYKLALSGTVAIFAPSLPSRKTSPWRITATTLPVSGSTI